MKWICGYCGNVNKDTTTCPNCDEEYDPELDEVFEE